MTLEQTLALFDCLRRALLMIVRHLEGLMGELMKNRDDDVTISLEEAYVAYAVALGLTVKTLTDDEKRAALMAHVMEKLG